MDQLTTWDGQAVSPESPHGATVIVFRRKEDSIEFLLLHRAANGADYEGDWAWTPPSGARLPGESIEACAARELREETGLELSFQLTDFGNQEWLVFCAEASADGPVILDAEHDCFDWTLPSKAVRLCKPVMVSEPLQKYCAWKGIPCDSSSESARFGSFLGG